MTVNARKYNPGFLSDDELVALFCVRLGEFHSLVEVLRDCDGNANTHQIVIGQRGSGKTSLLLRVAVEVQRDADLSSRFLPVVFAEESYEVATAGEFWLECLRCLAERPGGGTDGPDLYRTYEELRGIRDDRMLGERCLGALQDFSDREDRRLLLIVENLNMMFGDMPDRDAGWRLRQTLQTEPRIVLLASATSRFDEIDDPGRALYGLFRVLTLRPLEAGECAELWRNVSRQDRAERTMRALRILTGGSPRLLTIMAQFGAELSFRKLMDELLDLVDDHTEYFKSHLETLPQQERRVYLALADLWKPATAAEVADRARLDTSKASAQLNRLRERGAVEVTGGTAKRRFYYLSERLYNIYYLMRRSRGPDPLIKALIQFMEAYYSPDELREFGTRIAFEAAEIDGETRRLYRAAFDRLVKLPALMPRHDELLSMAQPILPDRPTSKHGRSSRLDDVHQVVTALMNMALALEAEDRPDKALAVWTELLSRFEASREPAVVDAVATAMVSMAATLSILGRTEEALAAWNRVVDKFSASDIPGVSLAVAVVLVLEGIAFLESKQEEKAIAVSEEVERRFGADGTPEMRKLVAMCLLNKGTAFAHLDRLEEAIGAWDRVVEGFGDSATRKIAEQQVAMALNNKGMALDELGRKEEAAAAWQEVVDRFGKTDEPVLVEALSKALVNKAAALAELGEPEEALAIWDEVVQRFAGSEATKLRLAVATSLFNKARALIKLTRMEEAVAALDEVVLRYSDSDDPEVRDVVDTVSLIKAEMYSAKRRAREAVDAAERVLRRAEPGSPYNRFWGHRIRASIRFREGNRTGGAADIEALLKLVPPLGSIRRHEMVAILKLALQCGLAEMRDLIRSSPAADLLLPLTTALELELGLEPRVAREVEEVAEDIRREIAELRASAAD